MCVCGRGTNSAFPLNRAGHYGALTNPQSHILSLFLRSNACAEVTEYTFSLGSLDRDIWVELKKCKSLVGQTQ